MRTDLKDHRAIGKAYLAAGSFILALGAAIAVAMRLHHAAPGRLLTQPDAYAVLFTSHSTLMVFFAVTPMLVFGLGFWRMPVLIGSRGIALPGLARAGLFLYAASALVFLGSFALPGGPAKSGWFAYAPLSVAEPIGQSAWLISLSVLNIGTLCSAISLVVTVINHRREGLGWWRMPVLAWSIFLAAAMEIAARPALCVAAGALLSDRLFGSSFFIPDNLVIGARVFERGGGQPLLWQHLFWFFGHPIVYIIILPVMGIISETLAAFSSRGLYGYRTIVGSQIAIAILSFAVWGHHLVVTGMNPLVASGFMLSTIAIALPSALEVFAWLGTLAGGPIRWTAAMLSALAFLTLFIIGGLTGVMLALVPVNVQLHGTAFITAHFHYVMAGATLFGLLSALYAWWPRPLSDMLARWHVGISFLLFNAVFIPLFVVGLSGEPRRMFDFSAYPSLQALQMWRVASGHAAACLLFVQLLLVWNVILSLRRVRPSEDYNAH